MGTMSLWAKFAVFMMIRTVCLMRQNRKREFSFEIPGDQWGAEQNIDIPSAGEPAEIDTPLSWRVGGYFDEREMLVVE
jgi:hypothetical protein